MVAVPAQDKDDLRRVLDDDGKPLPGAKVPSIPDATLQRIFDKMMLVRIMDERMMRLQRQGRIGFYMRRSARRRRHFGASPRCATATGSSRATASSARRSGAATAPATSSTSCSATRRSGQGPADAGPLLGELAQLRLDQLAGRHADPAGRRLRLGREDAQARTTSRSSTSARARPRRGEFHDGMNFAGVFKAPCVFFCRNNGWAISVPSRAADRGARRSPSRRVAYGIPACASTATISSRSRRSRATRSRARARGEGPTLIEALTYRVQRPLDARRSDGVPRPRRARAVGDEAIRSTRLRALPRARAGCGARRCETELRARRPSELTDARRGRRESRRPPLETMFEDVYAELPWHLARAARGARRRSRAPRPAPPRMRTRPMPSDEHGPGDQRRAAHRDARATRASSCSARTSARSAASSASRRASSTSSATTA